MKTIKVFFKESIGIRKFQALCFKTAEIAGAEMTWQAPLFPKDRRGTYGSRRSAVFKKDGNISVIEFEHSYVIEMMACSPYNRDQYKYHEILVHGPNDTVQSDPFIMDSLYKAIEQFSMEVDGTHEDTEMFNTIMELVGEPFSIEDEEDRKFSNFYACMATKLSDYTHTRDGYIVVLEKGHTPLDQCGIVYSVFDAHGENVLNSETPYPWLLKDKAFLKRCLTAAIRNAESWKTSFPNDNSFKVYGSMYWRGLGGWNNNPYGRASHSFKNLTVKDIPAKPRQVSKKKMKKHR